MQSMQSNRCKLKEMGERDDRSAVRDLFYFYGLNDTLTTCFGGMVIKMGGFPRLCRPQGWAIPREPRGQNYQQDKEAPQAGSAKQSTSCSPVVGGPKSRWVSAQTPKSTTYGGARRISLTQIVPGASEIPFGMVHTFVRSTGHDSFTLVSKSYGPRHLMVLRTYPRIKAPSGRPGDYPGQKRTVI